MNVKQLRAFVTVAKYQSFARPVNTCMFRNPP